jgi:hypothetical protein
MSAELRSLAVTQTGRSDSLTALYQSSYKRGVTESLWRSLHTGVHECHDLPEPGPIAVGGVDVDRRSVD